MTEKTSTATAQIPARKLNDAELEGASGGSVNATTGDIYMSGRIQCGHRNRNTGEITYRPCPRCGKPMHTQWYQTKWYCDPCDFSEYRPREATWSGTVKSLVRAAR